MPQKEAKPSLPKWQVSKGVLATLVNCENFPMGYYRVRYHNMKHPLSIPLLTLIEYWDKFSMNLTLEYRRTHTKNPGW